MTEQTEQQQAPAIPAEQIHQPHPGDIGQWKGDYYEINGEIVARVSRQWDDEYPLLEWAAYVRNEDGSGFEMSCHTAAKDMAVSTAAGVAEMRFGPQPPPAPPSELDQACARIAELESATERIASERDDYAEELADKRARIAELEGQIAAQSKADEEIFKTIGDLAGYGKSKLAEAEAARAKLAALEAQQAEMRRLLSEAGPVVEELRPYLNPPYRFSELARMLEHLPTLLSLLEQLQKVVGDD